MWFDVRGGSLEEAIRKTGGRRTFQLGIVVARGMENIARLSTKLWVGLHSLVLQLECRKC